MTGVEDSGARVPFQGHAGREALIKIAAAGNFYRFNAALQRSLCGANRYK